VGREWFWEGNIQASLIRFLADEGWILQSAADTASKAHGVDVLATSRSRTLAIEVKGYPSTGYADPRRAHERKRTIPTNHAVHWFAQALLKAMRLRSSMPDAEIAIALPHFPRYLSLLRDTEDSIRRLGLGVYVVAELDAVSLLVPHRPRGGLSEELLPFDSYEGGGRHLLGTPPFGGGSIRRDYGVPVFEQCGWSCAYCGVDLGDAYEGWLGLSVEHVVPQSLLRQGYLEAWIEDITNKVTCCRHCNEFLNQFAVSEPVPATLDQFFDLRDRVFQEKRKRAVERHASEREWYDTWRTSRGRSGETNA
jgi:hypothetical protein